MGKPCLAAPFFQRLGKENPELLLLQFLND